MSDAGRSYTAIRPSVFREKGEECHACGSEENLEVHHIDCDRSNNSMENLVPLCSECHSTVHNGVPEYEELERLQSKLPRQPDHFEGTMVSGKIDRDVNREVDELKSELGLNKKETVAYLVEKGVEKVKGGTND